MYSCAVTDKSGIYATAIAVATSEISVLRATANLVRRISTLAAPDRRCITRDLCRRQGTLENITEKL